MVIRLSSWMIGWFCCRDASKSPTTHSSNETKIESLQLAVAVFLNVNVLCRMFSKKLAVCSDHNKFWGFVCITPVNVNCQLEPKSYPEKLTSTYLCIFVIHLYCQHLLYWTSCSSLWIPCSRDQKCCLSCIGAPRSAFRCSWCMFGFTSCWPCKPEVLNRKFDQQVWILVFCHGK